MAEFETKYRNYVIRYDTGDGLWKCRELDLSAPQLKTLQGLIDKGSLDARRVNLPALRMKNRRYGFSFDKHRSELEAVTLTTLAERGECWIKTSGGREKASLYDLFPATDETRAAFAVWKAAIEAETAAREKAVAAEKAIPRIKVPAKAIPKTPASAD